MMLTCQTPTSNAAYAELGVSSGLTPSPGSSLLLLAQVFESTDAPKTKQLQNRRGCGEKRTECVREGNLVVLRLLQLMKPPNVKKFGEVHSVVMEYS